jgi:hypothetical protein
LACSFKKFCDRGEHYEIVSGNILCTNAKPPLTIRYFYEPPVELFPHYFIEYLVSSLVEEMSPLFGYNLSGQQVYQSRNYGPNGKLGTAIQQELLEHPPIEEHRSSRLLCERNW